MKRSLLAFVAGLLLVTSAYAQEAKVNVYVTDWCPYCKKLESFLKQSHIQYTRYDVEKDDSARATFEKLGGNGVPMATVGDEVIHGYDPQKLLTSIGRHSSK